MDGVAPILTLRHIWASVVFLQSLLDWDSNGICSFLFVHALNYPHSLHRPTRSLTQNFPFLRQCFSKSLPFPSTIYCIFNLFPWHNLSSKPLGLERDSFLLPMAIAQCRTLLSNPPPLPSTTLMPHVTFTSFTHPPDTQHSLIRPVAIGKLYPWTRSRHIFWNQDVCHWITLKAKELEDTTEIVINTLLHCPLNSHPFWGHSNF